MTLFRIPISLLLLNVILSCSVSQKKDLLDAIDLYEQDKLESALKVVDSLIGLDSTNYLYYETRGMIFNKQEDYPLAFKNYQKAIDHGSPEASTYSNAGNAAFILGDSLNAMNLFLAAYRMDSTLEKINYNLGIIAWLYRKMPEQALTYFRKELQYNETSEVLNAIAQINLNLGKVEQSLECYNRSLSLDNTNEMTILLKGLVYFEIEQYNKALECFDSGLYLNKNNFEMTYYRCLSNYYLDDMNQCCLDFFQLQKLTSFSSNLDDPVMNDIKKQCEK